MRTPQEQSNEDLAKTLVDGIDALVGEIRDVQVLINVLRKGLRAGELVLVSNVTAEEALQCVVRATKAFERGSNTLGTGYMNEARTLLGLKRP